MNNTNAIDALGFDFFREFARGEYCMKVVGLRLPNRKDPTADWRAFAAELNDLLSNPSPGEVANAVEYYLNNPPKKQVLRDGLLDWDSVEPNHASQTELILLLVCRVRNNLFHGGKFNGEWFAPERSDHLLRHGISILRAAIAAHPRRKDAYDNKAI